MYSMAGQEVVLQRNYKIKLLLSKRLPERQLFLFKDFYIAQVLAGRNVINTIIY